MSAYRQCGHLAAFLAIQFLDPSIVLLVLAVCALRMFVCVCVSVMARFGCFVSCKTHCLSHTLMIVFRVCLRQCRCMACARRPPLLADVCLCLVDIDDCFMVRRCITDEL